MSKQHGYLCGPMTGRPHFNFPLFHAAARELRARGWEITSPAELDSPEAKKAAEESLTGDASHYAANDSWGDLLARDVKLIADGAIDAIICLPGWERSRGGKLETYVARLCGLPLLEYPTLDEIHVNRIDYAHGHENASYKLLADRTKEVQEMEFVPDEYRDDPHEVRVTDPKTGGEKGSKPAQFGALDPEALLRVAEVAGFGTKKYARLNYLKGFDWSLAYDALQRHTHEFWAGREIDEESGLPHMAHAAWQAMCLLSFMERKLGADDRISAGRHLPSPGSNHDPNHRVARSTSGMSALCLEPDCSWSYEYD